MNGGSGERGRIVPQKIRIRVVSADVAVVLHNKVLELRILNVELTATGEEVLSVEFLKCINNK